MKRPIKLKFIDCSPGFVPEKDICFRLLSKHYEVLLSDTPDYVISWGLGYHHVRYDSCVKIVLCGENVVPDFNWFDYAVGFDFLRFDDRYLRMPLYARYDSYYRLAEPQRFSDEYLLHRGFCSFVVSAPRRNPIGEKFFQALSKYKPVASGGRLLNNVGGPVPDKLTFCSKYKFNIAFENSSSSGYTTEKIMEPLTVGSVPIYWGNPRIAEDFNETAFVRVPDDASIPAVIDEIVRLDRDDAAYLAKCRATCLAEPCGVYERRLEDFLCHIVDQPLPQAKRLNAFGCQALQRQRVGKMFSGYQFAREAAWKVINALHIRI